MRQPAHGADAPSAGARVWGWFREIAIIAVAALVLSLIIKTFFFQSFWIPSGSMHPTLLEGDRILVTKWRPDPLELRRGDVIVFKDPGGWLSGEETVPVTGVQKGVQDLLQFVGLLPEDSGEHLVKRVIGLPGDTVECDSADSQVKVNGVALQEDYLAQGSQPCGAEFTITVPADSLWVMGDNRDNSADSRYHMGLPGGGTIPMSSVVGTAFVTVWPIDHWGGIGNPLVDSGQA
ncbi:signal peptidase I [Demequina capsici]|uniref:Signal peptidase I n=1 Tax=Demequina capsici TaxID=3075620 RepID=A0AA96F612_9MICO|nr:signal peptidase I [Demequina sp. OYTSA14]WNM23432.1 signal peptidase I [Demequina sp. OYTSA14]